MPPAKTADDGDRRGSRELAELEVAAGDGQRLFRPCCGDDREREAEQDGGEGEQGESGGRCQVEHELAAGEGCVGRDHVDREHRAAGGGGRLGVEPAFGGDEQAGAAEPHQRPKHRPQRGWK